MTKKTTKGRGRPTKFTKKLATSICNQLTKGKSIRTIVQNSKMPSSSTIFRWLLDEKRKDFWEQYNKARNIQAELMFEELVEIADDDINDVQRDRLRVDTRKWYLSKIVPKKYGDKMDITSDGQPLSISFDSSFNKTEKEEN